MVLFLGAGASVPYGKPTTKQLMEKLAPEDSKIRYSFKNSLLRCPEFLDIEYVLTAALQIREFLYKSLGGIYFKYLSETQNALHTTRDPDAGNVRFHLTLPEWNEVVTSLEDDVFNNYRWEGKYDEDLEQIYNPIFDLLKEYSEEIVICTTNYDKAIENYCEIKQYWCVDGFKEKFGAYRWCKGEFYYPQKIEGKTYVYLYKLHGSLDWKENRNEEIIKTHEEGRPSDPSYKGNLLVYPTLDPKPREAEPFTSIMNEFIKRIDDADIIIVIGFSFRDKAISDLLLTQSKKLIIIDGGGMLVYYKNILHDELPSNDSVMMLPNGINTYCRIGDSTDLILHNIDKSNIKDIASAINQLMSANRQAVTKN